MALGPLERRIEDADEDQVSVVAPAQIVLVMLVEHIDVALAERIDIAVHVLNLAFPSDAVASLEMVAVLKQ